MGGAGGNIKCAGAAHRRHNLRIVLDTQCFLTFMFYAVFVYDFVDLN